MNVSIKEQELIDEMLNKVIAKYPEVSYSHLESSPDDRSNIWVIVKANVDEDKEIKMRKFSSKLEYHILMDYGYQISMMYDKP